MTSEKRKREAGMITVEAVLSLVPFIMVILGIISFINIYMVHNKIQYAMYQVGSELSAYTYFYEALNIRGAEAQFQGDADKETTELDQTIVDTTEFISQLGNLETSFSNVGSSGLAGLENDFNQVKTDAENTKNAAGNAVNSIKVLVSDPKDMARNVVYYILEVALDKGKTAILGEVAQGMISNYLDSTFSTSQPLTADEYLRWVGVKDGLDGLTFSNSHLFADSEHKMIDIVVEYDIEVYLFKLFKKDPTIHVVQRCVLPAWLDGDGIHYKGE